MAVKVPFRTHLVAALGEFFGTVLFLLLALGGIQAAYNANRTAQGSAVNDSGASNSFNRIAGVEQLLYVATSMGLSLLVTTWFFFRSTGSIFNPQVALALMICRIISPIRFALYVVAHLVGAIVAAALLQALLPGSLAVTPALGNGTTIAQGVFIEMFITAALVLAFLTLAGADHHHNSSPSTFTSNGNSISSIGNQHSNQSSNRSSAPIGIGLTLFAGQLWGFLFTGAAMNTARAFGPAVITGFAGHHWIYWVGPTLGSLLASGVYLLLKTLGFWDPLPGHDGINNNDSGEVPLAGRHSNGYGDNNRVHPTTAPNGEKLGGVGGVGPGGVGGVGNNNLRGNPVHPHVTPLGDHVGPTNTTNTGGMRGDGVV